MAHHSTLKTKIMENNKNNNIDFIGIGDITTDAFISLQQAEVHCKLDTDQCEICMKWGDKIPFEKAVEVRAVGNSVNASFSAKRLGLSSAVITNIGDDDNGKRCKEALEEEGVITDFVKTNPKKSTNYHYVLSYNAERTILVKHEVFDYTSLPHFPKPKYIYLSSLGETADPIYKLICNYLKENPDVNLSFQPGTFQIKVGFEPLKDIYKHSKIFFCNKDEAGRVLKKESGERIQDLLKGIHELGPKIVVITDGPKGAYTYDGNEILYMPTYPDPKPPVERTGAGDAFSSAFTAFIASGMDIKEALKRAPINSMSVVQYIGAREGLLTKEKIDMYLNTAPKDYKIRNL